MATIRSARPSWYTNEDDSAWDNVKEAFRRDWQQTKHDFGSNVPDLNQQVGDTISQAAGSKPIPPGNAKTPHPSDTADVDKYDETYEPAYRYGYAAYNHYHSDWDDTTEANLRKEWGDDANWVRTRAAIRRGWEYGSRAKPR